MIYFFYFSAFTIAMQLFISFKNEHIFKLFTLFQIFFYPTMSMIAPTLDIDGILDKRPYKPEPFTEEELTELKSQATITISNQTGVTWNENKWVTEQLGSLNLTKSPITIDNSGVAKLYVFSGKQACEVALEILAKTGFKTGGNEKCYKQNIITVDTGERVNLNYISATKKHEIMTKQIELLWCEIENTKTAFLLYPEEVPEYLIAPHPSYPISSSPPTN
jgi:hypothetical protein